jgi:hypothetical protein
MNNVCGSAMHFAAHTPTEASWGAHRKNAPYRALYQPDIQAAGSRTPEKLKLVVRIDLWIAVCLVALALLLFYASESTAADAVRRYGRNIDSGVLEWMAAVLYMRSRPARSGGGVPAPGAYGFRRGSIYEHLRVVYRISIICPKLAINGSASSPLIIAAARETRSRPRAYRASRQRGFDKCRSPASRARELSRTGARAAMLTDRASERQRQQ